MKKHSRNKSMPVRDLANVLEGKIPTSFPPESQTNASDSVDPPPPAIPRRPSQSRDHKKPPKGIIVPSNPVPPGPPINPFPPRRASEPSTLQEVKNSFHRRKKTKGPGSQRSPLDEVKARLDNPSDKGPSTPGTDPNQKYIELGGEDLEKRFNIGEDESHVGLVKRRSADDDWEIDDPRRLYDEQFDNVFNIRELGGIRISEVESIRLGHVYRSATLDYCTPNDISKLVKRLHIKTIIDLRREADVEKSGGDQKHFNTFTEDTLFNSSANQSSIPGRKRILVNLISVNYQVETLKALPDKTEFFSHIIKGKFEHLPKYVAQNAINDAGLIQIYLNIIDKAHKQIGTAIKIMSDPNNLPVLFHCAHGKDRTGIIAALLLAFVGVSDRDIARDYQLTEVGLENWTDLVHREICEYNHLADEFTESKAYLMLVLLHYIKENYGSIGNFLAICGVTTEYQVQLRKNLVVCEYVEDEIKDTILKQRLLDDHNWKLDEGNTTEPFSTRKSSFIRRVFNS